MPVSQITRAAELQETELREKEEILKRMKEILDKADIERVMKYVRGDRIHHVQFILPSFSGNVTCSHL